MAAIEWITVKGFKSIDNIDKLKLQNINVIIGSNGSGKSNFIGVFSFLHAIREGRLKEYVGRSGGANTIIHFGTKHTKSIKIQVSFSGDVNQYEIELVPSQNGGLIPFNEVVSYWNKNNHSQPYRQSVSSDGEEAGISSELNSSIAEYVQSRLDSWRLYHFHDTSQTSPLKQICDLNDNRYLRSDGSNLAAFLYMLKEKHSESYSLISKMVSSAAPFFDDFSLHPMTLNEERIQLEWRHCFSDSYFSASTLSDGTIRFVALATLLLQPSVFRPSVILIDEPELGLHPYALTLLASMIKRASITTQIILSTQSALLLDHFEPENVLVADLVDNGTQLNRLSNEQLEDWLEEYSLGELWEKAEFGGRPKPSVAGQQ